MQGLSISEHRSSVHSKILLLFFLDLGWTTGNVVPLCISQEHLVAQCWKLNAEQNLI